MDKSQRLNIRVTPDEHAVLRRAAALTGQTVSEYIRRRVLAEAEDDLADRSRFALDGAAWTEFKEQVARAGTYNERVARLLSEASPWEADEQRPGAVVDLMEALAGALRAARSKPSTRGAADAVEASLAEIESTGEWRVIVAPRSANLVIVGDEADTA